MLHSKTSDLHAQVHGCPAPKSVRGESEVSQRWVYLEPSMWAEFTLFGDFLAIGGDDEEV